MFLPVKLPLVKFMLADEAATKRTPTPVCHIFPALWKTPVTFMVVAGAYTWRP